MPRFLCCCCCCSPGENSSNERQPLLQPRSADQNGAESARQTRPARSDAKTTGRTAGLAMRRVCVPELDQQFSVIVEAFNEQQESYESMARSISNLRQSCGCARGDDLTISESVERIREKHKDKYTATLKLRGYDFFLCVVPLGSGDETEVESLSPGLRLAQDELKCTSKNAKATISKDTSLQELIRWLLGRGHQMAEQVREKATTYQEQGRLNENLEKNMKEVQRAKELSLRYSQQAREVLTEAAQIANAHM